MFSAKRITMTSVAALATLSWAHTISAEELSASSSVPDAVATPSAVSSSSDVPKLSPVITDVRRSPFGSKPLTAAVLASKRGGDRVFNDAQLKGVVADNQASNLTTGANIISEGALAGSSGMPTVIQNSGNNVLIQNSTIVNVQVK